MANLFAVPRFQNKIGGAKISEIPFNLSLNEIMRNIHSREEVLMAENFALNAKVDVLNDKVDKMYTLLSKIESKIGIEKQSNELVEYRDNDDEIEHQHKDDNGEMAKQSGQMVEVNDYGCIRKVLMEAIGEGKGNGDTGFKSFVYDFIELNAAKAYASIKGTKPSSWTAQYHRWNNAVKIVSAYMNKCDEGDTEDGGETTGDLVAQRNSLRRKVAMGVECMWKDIHEGVVKNKPRGGKLTVTYIFNEKKAFNEAVKKRNE